MTDKDTLIAELESSHDRFRSAIEGLPEDAYHETWLGTWTLNNVLAHMAGWYREMGTAFDRVGQGQRPAPEGVDLGDTEGWNAKFALQTKPTGTEALADWDEAYTRYATAARALPSELWGIDPAKDRPRIGNRLIEGAGIGHFAEHQPELDQWLRSRNGT